MSLPSGFAKLVFVLVGLGGFVMLLWGARLPEPCFTAIPEAGNLRPLWKRGQPSAAGCEIDQQADTVRITIPGIKLKGFDSGGLSGMPATEAPFTGQSAISLRLRQTGIGEWSKGLVTTRFTNRPHTEAGIHLADSSGEVAFYLRCRVIYFSQTNECEQQIEIERRTPKSSYTSGIGREPASQFVDLNVRIVADELQAWYSTTEKTKWVHLKSFALAERPTSYGVCAFSNADSKTTFDFGDIKLTPDE